MVSVDTVDRMVDETDDLSEVRQNPMEQATELTPSNAQEAMGEIYPEQNFTAALYGSKLGVWTLTWYYSTYLIPEGVVLSTPGDTRAFEAPVGSITLF